MMLAYLSIDKLKDLGYSNRYEGALEQLRQQADEINASMNPLVRYLDRASADCPACRTVEVERNYETGTCKNTDSHIAF